MWVGDYSLAQLETMIHGYTVALAWHGVQEFGSDFNARFRDHLLERFGWSMSCGWAAALLEEFGEPRAAFDKFFELVDEFAQHDGNAA